MTDPYASTGDVETVLGNLKGRLPANLSPLADFLAMAHAETMDVLTRVYPAEVPAFAGDGLTAVRWAEAKIAAAEVLEAVRVNLPDLGDQPDRLRASAMRTLVDGVIGYPAGGIVVDTDGAGGSVTGIVGPQPRVSSFTPASAWPDPYAPLRDLGIENL